jgi:hypothetical protein
MQDKSETSPVPGRGPRTAGKRGGTHRRSTRWARVLLVAIGALSLAAIHPATAATSGTSAATITIQSGFLSITVPANAGNLGTRANSVVGGTISGSLGVVQVSDARGAPAGSGWVASAISSAFTPPAGPTVPASAVGYQAGVITKIGTATYTANEPTDLTGASAVVTATGITGDNSATWNPTINIAVPGGMAPGVYVATITHSVL